LAFPTECLNKILSVFFPFEDIGLLEK
jgi:hypothetical protein